MIGKLLPLALACAAGPALALSCLPPDPVQSYMFARDDDALHSMVIGRISSDRPIAEPRATQASQFKDNHAESPVTLTGRGLTADGFTVDVRQKITLRLSCAAAWCPGAPPLDQELFLIFRHDNDARIAEIGACPMNALPWSAEDEARVVACHRKGQCETRF
ncbi:MAG: hypothetical protein OIF48_07050 [Silicimonas sp.]|nr:hypothetical protein [Silicimonas sp.]